MENIKQWLKENKTNLIIIFIYAVVTLTTIIFHEQWRDEAQQWLLARDLSIPKLYEQMTFEGHFTLWYLILMPFAKLGFPFITANIISWIIMIFSVWLLLTRSPFSKRTKYLLVFTAPFIYYYSVVSRVYCLIPLAEILLAITFKDRESKPFKYIFSLLLLANTHIIMWGQVGILFFEYLIQIIKKKKNDNKIEIKNNVISIIVFFVFMILSAFPLLNSVQSNGDVTFVSNINIVTIFKFVIFNPLIQIKETFSLLGQIIGLEVFIVLSLSICFVISHTKKSFEIIVTCLWQYMIYTFLYCSNIWRNVVIIPEMIFFMWNIEKEEKKDNFKYQIKNSMNVLLIISVINGIYINFFDVVGKFSGSKDVAKYIKNNVEQNSVIVVGDSPEMCSPIIANNCNIDFYSIQLGHTFTYVEYNNEIRKHITIEDILGTKEKFKGKNIYYIYTPEKYFEDNDSEIVEELVKNKRLEEVYRMEEKTFDINEKYILYKLI